MTKGCERGVEGTMEAEGAPDKTLWCEIYKENFLDEGGDEKRNRQNGLGVRE